MRSGARPPRFASLDRSLCDMTAVRITIDPVACDAYGYCAFTRDCRHSRGRIAPARSEDRSDFEREDKIGRGDGRGVAQDDVPPVFLDQAFKLIGGTLM